ncbi:MAG: hypothetical protein P8075_00115 [Deltaproteobacteria bacterium]
MASIYQFRRDPQDRDPVDGKAISKCFCEIENRFLLEWEAKAAIKRLIQRIFGEIED